MYHPRWGSAGFVDLTFYGSFPPLAGPGRMRAQVV